MATDDGQVIIARNLKMSGNHDSRPGQGIDISKS